MKHEPTPDQTTSTRGDVAIQHRLHRDFETRSRTNLKKVGAAVYAADPSTEIICMAFAVDDGLVQRWFPGDPVPPEWFEAAANPNWTATAHNDPFETAIETHILHPRFGFPLIPAERHRCTQAAALALALPAKLGLLADAMGFRHRKDVSGERLMHQMTKPRKPRKDEDPDGVYWHEDEDKFFRLSDYNCQDVEVEREAGTTLPPLSDAEQKVWLLSNKINERGFPIDREFAEAARRIAEAAGPEIDAELRELTEGAVRTINQVQKLKDWLKAKGCDTPTLDSDTIEELLEDENLAAPVRRVLELRAGGAQAAVKKIGALLARAGADDRIRGAFRYHGASTGRWSGEGYQPQNLKRPEVEDLDAAIAAVMTGDYVLMKHIYPKPLSVVGDCSRAMIAAPSGYELIGADLGSIESRAAAWVAGEEWKLNSYRRFDETHDPRDEPYCITACKIFGVPDGTFTKTSPERKVGKTCDLAFNYAGGLGAWRKFEPDRFTDEEVETFKQEWRANHPKIVQYWHSIDRAAVGAVYEPGVEIVCGPVVLVSDDKFLRIRLPSGRDLSYPNPRLIVDDRDNARVVFDDNGGGRFAPCRGGFGAYSGIWFENIVSGISRDILVEAMFRIEAAGLPIVLHIHDECVCEVPIGSGDEQEFVRLMTQPPSWALDLPIAANAWRGYRYDKSGKSETLGAARSVVLEASDETTEDVCPDAPPSSATNEAVAGGLSLSFTQFEAIGERLSKLYLQATNGRVFGLGGTQMSRGKYQTIAIEAADPPAVLAEIGKRIDVLNSNEAIGLGVVEHGLPRAGAITTKNRYERCHDNPRSGLRDAIPRALSHFNWPGEGALGLLYFDGDERDGLHEILTALYPPFAEVAGLVRPSASASVKDPLTGERLKAGEHLFVLLEEPAKAKACLEAIRRMAWCVGVGRSAGWLGLAKDGDPLPYGPVDVTVGSPERLVYEGEIVLGKGLERLPRISKVIGGSGVLCAADLIAFADQHAPETQYNKLVQAAKNDPAFLAQQAAVKATYRADKIEKAVAKGLPREEVEREFDRVTREAGERIGERIWRELSPHDVLFFPDGRSFTAAEMGADPGRFHKKECADPVEGLDYKSRNPGWILHQGGRVEIYSRAHSDRYAYFLPLHPIEELGALQDTLNDPAEGGAAAGLNAEIDEAKAEKAREKEAKEKAKQERKEAREAKARAKAEAEAETAPVDEAPDTNAQAPSDEAPASEPPEEPAATTPSAWFFVMLGFENQTLFEGTTYGPYTNEETPGKTYGPYAGRDALLSAFLTRCAKENIGLEYVVEALLGEHQASDKAICSYCRDQGITRDDLEKRLTQAKADVARDRMKSAGGSTDIAIDVIDVMKIGGGKGGGGSGGGGGGGSSGPQPGFFGTTKRIIKYIAGQLSEVVDQVSRALIDEDVPFFQRGQSLVRPVTVPVQSFHGKMTTASQLVHVSLPYLRDKLGRYVTFVKYDGRSRRWKDIDPPPDPANVLLERYGDWDFRVIAGIISTPTMRPDGTILSQHGYDPATQLLLIDPPAMPDIPDNPTREDALGALGVLKHLIREFPFVKDDDGVSLAVALSAIISPVCRGAYPIVPVHIIDAPEAGTGKSYLLSTVSWITTGQPMPALGSDKQEELDKRLDAAVLSGQSLICIDNLVNALGGETICRLTEQWRAQVRIFGVLELVSVDARGITFFVNGNNVIVRGDFYRRTVKSRLDALMERPKDRQFAQNPMKMVLADRGKYIAACLTVCRAYIAAGRPGCLPQLASYGEWSDTVRSALVWLGEADPVKSQEPIQDEDPEKVALDTLLNEWEELVGAGEANGKSVRDIIDLCDDNKPGLTGKEYLNPGLRDAVLGVMPSNHRLKPNADALSYWLRSKKEKRAGKLRFRNKLRNSRTPTTWWVEREP